MDNGIGKIYHFEFDKKVLFRIPENTEYLKKTAGYSWETVVITTKIKIQD